MNIEFNLPPARPSGHDAARQPQQAKAALQQQPQFAALPDPSFNSIIKVFGVGGGGSNAVNNMFAKGITGVQFVVSNTDHQALNMSPIPTKLPLGRDLTSGLGCGADPGIGRQSALESIEEIRHMLSDGTRMVFVTAGMGGGTGTGGAPVIAALAREMGLLTVGIVTTPFRFEGAWRKKIADEGLAELRDCVDSLLVINNDNLLAICPKNARAREAYEMADNVLANAAKGIAEIITGNGYINSDFADVRTIMKNSGPAIMGMASYSGDNRAIMAAEEALNNPLMDNVDIQGATGVLINITASEQSLTLDEIDKVGEYVQQCAGDHARIILGQAFDDSLGDELRVTVVACGFSTAGKTNSRTQQTQMPAANTPRPSSLGAKKAPGARVQTSLFGQEADPKPEAKPEAQRPDPLQERRRNLGRRDLDFRNPNTFRELNEKPAYERDADLFLDLDSTGSRSFSRFSLETDAQGKAQLRDQNAYLFDNVD